MAVMKLKEAMKLLRGIQYYISVVLVLSYSLLATCFAATVCPLGEYNNGGICLPCVPCPKHNLVKWLEKKCQNDFQDCPKLCRVPDKEWEEEAGDEICDNLKPDTTTSPSTSKGGVFPNASSISMSYTDEPPTKLPNHGTNQMTAVTLVIVSLILVVGITSLVILIRKYYCRTVNEQSNILKLKSQSSTSFTINVSSKYKEKGYLKVFRENKFLTTEPKLQSGEYTFSSTTHGIYPNCQYMVILTKQDESQELESGMDAAKDRSLSFKIPGIELPSTSGDSSITLQLQNVDIEINSITGCLCLNNGMPIDVTGKSSFTIDGLQPGCKYPITSRVHTQEESSKGVINVGKQQIKTEGVVRQVQTCTTTLASILDKQDFKNDLVTVLSQSTLHDHEKGIACPGEVQQLRQNILTQARACCEKSSSSSSDNGGRFCDNLLWCDSSEEFVDAYNIELRDDKMRIISVKSLLIDNVINQKNKDQPPVKMLADLFFKFHSECLSCLTAIHVIMHEEPACAAMETDSMDDLSTTTFSDATDTTDNTSQLLLQNI